MREDQGVSDALVTLAATGVGAIAGLGGSWLTVRGQRKSERLARLEAAYGDFLGALHEVEIYLVNMDKSGTSNAIVPDELSAPVVRALGRVAVLAPFQTHQVAAIYAEYYTQEQYIAEGLDRERAVDLWTDAVMLMRRDLKR